MNAFTQICNPFPENLELKTGFLQPVEKMLNISGQYCFANVDFLCYTLHG